MILYTTDGSNNEIAEIMRKLVGLRFPDPRLLPLVSRLRLHQSLCVSHHLKSVEYGKDIDSGLVAHGKQLVGFPDALMEYAAGKSVFNGMRKCVIDGTRILVINRVVHPHYETYDWESLSTSKIWITHQVDFSRDIFGYYNVYSDMELVDTLSFLCAQLYRCDASHVAVWCGLPIAFDKFRVFVQKAKYLSIHTPLVHRDGSLVRIEEVLAAAPNAEEFVIRVRHYLISGGASIHRMMNLKNLGRMNVLEIYGISHDTDFDMLFEFLKTRRIGKRTVIEFYGAFIGYNYRFSRKLRILKSKIDKCPGLDDCFIE